ncbi:MAG: hypothetical protein LBF66_02215 [Holosporales bacterium]|jgi:hypothetical protein|nr:hypothetical protein [Holosporales bacterium]
MNILQCVLAVCFLGTVALPSVFGCEFQNNQSVLNQGDICKESDDEFVGVVGAPPYVGVPHTGASYDEFCVIADEAGENLAKILKQYGNNVNCALFVAHFEEVKEALAKMVYPYEKEGIVDIYLGGIFDRETTIDFLDDLAKNECYRKLFDRKIVSSSDEDCDENPARTGYMSDSLADDLDDEI